jgi:hypothetical protein
MEKRYSGIPLSAPLFRGAAESVLDAIVRSLSAASYSYADDSGREWGTGAERLQAAAKLVNELSLSFSAAHALYKATPQLVTFDQFMDAILADARKKPDNKKLLENSK